MAQLSIKPGDSLVIDGFDGEIVLNFDHISGRCASLTVDSPEEVSVKRRRIQRPDTDICSDLKEITEEVTSLFSEVDAATSQELLARFVSDLFDTQAQRRQKEYRRQKQAEGIAAAKARGVRFGTSQKPLPANFDQYYEAWRDGQLTATQAAEKCGISRAAFYRARVRMEQTRDRA